jgi:pimeloyl-ACP methyl ester carboxylesterase
VSRSATSRILLAAFLVSALSALLLAEDGAVSSRSPADISTIVIGFTGGFVRHDNPYHGPVRLAKRIQNNLPHGTYVRVFENRHRKSAYNAILRLLDRDHDGVLTGEEKAQAHIVLFGHSWGASAVVLLARELDRIGIPVLLTVQVDSVAKLWQSDGIIPDNVAAAVNFYQPHGFIHGRSLIRAADTSKTQILGNYRYDYNQAPVKCEGTSWFDRAFMASHIESECDPHLWSRVEDLVRQRLQPELGFVAAVPQP